MKGNLPPEYQFTTQQMGKGGKKINEFSLNTKWVCTNMFVQRQLTSWEHTSSQHNEWVKEVKEGTNFYSSHKLRSWACTNLFIQRQLTHYECNSSQHSKWAKGLKEGTNFTHHTKSNLVCAQTCAFKSNLPTKHSSVHKGVGKRWKERIFTHHIKSNLENAQRCSFKGNSPTKSAPVHNTASG